jgi:hypothetical protein
MNLGLIIRRNRRIILERHSFSSQTELVDSL